MQIARYAEIPWTSHPDLRGGARSTSNEGGTVQSKPKTLYKPLFRGTPGQPNHFEMVVSEYHAPKYYPRHRHDIDQLRLTLRGESPWGPGMVTPVGSLVYIPAGTYYGPYERPAGVELFAVQFEGANQAPFVDFDSLLAAQQELLKKGSFENGLYHWVDDAGARHERDGHEAGWQQATGRTQAFPEARFTLPIEINPSGFQWRTLSVGAQVKELGTFGELGTRLAMVGLEAGASWTVPPHGQTTLMFVTMGSGTATGLAIHQRDGIRLEGDDEMLLRADERIELFVLGLPKPAEARGSLAGVEPVSFAAQAGESESFRAQAHR